jgi:hypothetical protein
LQSSRNGRSTGSVFSTHRLVKCSMIVPVKSSLHQSKPHPCRHCLDPARLAKKNNGTWWVQTTFLAVSVSRRWWQGRNPGPPANLPARLPLAVLANHPQRRPAGRPGTRWPSVRSNCMLASPSALSKSAEQRSISIFRPPLSISYYIVRPSSSIVTACRPYACMSDVTNLTIMLGYGPAPAVLSRRRNALGKLHPKQLPTT